MAVTCHLVLFMMHPVFVAQTLQHVPFWSSDPYSTILPCVQSPQSSWCTSTIDTVGKKDIFSQVSFSLHDWGCLFIDPAWLLLSLICIIGCLLIIGIRPLDSLLNRNVFGLSNLGLIGIDHIWNKDVFISISFTTFFSLFALWIWSMLLPVHCFGGCMMMTLCVICHIFCRSFQASLKQSLCPCQRLCCWEASILKKMIVHILLGYLLKSSTSLNLMW